MNKKRKPIILLLILIMAISLFGCDGEDPQSSDDGATTRIVTDALGRNVDVPKDVNRIVALGNTPRMITYLDIADKVVGVGSMDLKDVTPVTAYAYANKDLWKDVPVVGTDAMGNTSYNAEEIVKCEPDIILCTYTKDVVNEIEEKTGLPVVSVSTGELFSSDYDESLRILGETCNVTDRAEEVIDYVHDTLDDLDKRTASVKDSDKPSVLSAAATYKGAHGIEGVRIKDPVLDAVNADNIAKDTAGKDSAMEVDREQLLKWDPDYIFCDYSGVGIVKKDIGKNRDFYEQLKAYKTKSIYQHPSSTSYYSNLEIPLVNCYYIGSVIYPENFSDVDIDKKSSEIYEFFLGDKKFGDKLKKYGATYGRINEEH